jgi:hypothetical protein
LSARAFRDGDGCAKDLEKARELYEKSAELGDVVSMNEAGQLHDVDSVQRWRWWSKAARRGMPFKFSKNFSNVVDDFVSGLVNKTSPGSKAVLFLIGRALQGNVDMESKRIFRAPTDFSATVKQANFAIDFYQKQISAYKRAVNAWSLVALKLGIWKDVRLVIAKLVWEAREEANYFSGLLSEWKSYKIPSRSLYDSGLPIELPWKGINEDE